MDADHARSGPAAKPTAAEITKSVEDRLVQEVRRSYIRHREHFEVRRHGYYQPYFPGPTWDGGVKSNQRYPNIWPKITTFMVRHQFQFDACIAHRFSLLSTNSRAVWPSQLCDVAFLEDYRRVTLESYVERRRRLATELELFQSKLFSSELVSRDSGKEMLLQVLLDETQEFGPLFRYCMGVKSKLWNVARRYSADALSQYITSPELYDTVWEELIPPKFKNFGCEIRSLIASRREVQDDNA